MMNNCDKIIAVSSGVADDLNGSWGISKDKIVIIQPTVDQHEILQLSREAVDDEWLRGNNKILISVSRLVQQKRIDVLIRAFHGCKMQMGEGAINHTRLIICGDGPIRHELEEIVKDIGASGYIKFIGRQDNPFKWMARAVAFISTSDWEGMPTTLMEAQALGIPIIASDCPSGPEEILKNGKYGYLFHPGDVMGCMQAISRVLNNPEEAVTRAMEGYKESTRYSPGVIAEMYANMFQSLARL